MFLSAGIGSFANKERMFCGERNDVLKTGINNVKWETHKFSVKTTGFILFHPEFILIFAFKLKKHEFDQTTYPQTSRRS